MEVFRRVMSLFMTDQCYGIFFEEFNFLNVHCLKALISKVLGYSIVMGAVLVKVPQIQKIVASKSVKGVSFLSVVMELYAITCMFSYSIANGFPFSTWGDSFFLLIQVTFIAALFQFYQGFPGRAALFVVVFLSILAVLLSGLTPMNVLSTLQISNMPAVVIAKLLQAMECFKIGHTGQLSAITIFLTLFGSAARIFTSIQETGDNIVILTYIVSTSANSVLAFQILWYWKATEEYVQSMAKKAD